MPSSSTASKWFCRIVPVAVWISLIAAKLEFPDSESIARNEGVYKCWVLATVAPYIVLIFMVLRKKLRPFCGPWVDSFAYVVFAGLTAGLGPVVLYWWRIEGKSNHEITG